MELSPDKYQITGIINNNVPLLWDKVWPLINEAVARSGEYDERAVQWELVEGRMQLWVVVRDDEEMIAALVSRFEEYPLKIVCQLVFCGGEEVKAWAAKFLEIFEPWALHNGAQEIRLGGRFGWERVLSEHGYTRDSILLSKKVSERCITDYFH